MTKKTSNPAPADTSPQFKGGVCRVAAEMEAQIDESLGLQAISIRLPKATIDTYKMLAQMNGVGYQPLMRDAICRWAEGELKQLLIGEVETKRQTAVAEASRKKAEGEDLPPPMKRAA